MSLDLNSIQLKRSIEPFKRLKGGVVNSLKENFNGNEAKLLELLRFERGCSPQARPKESEFSSHKCEDLVL